MPVCGLCLATVEKLHDKSHTLPKWMSKQAVNPEGIEITSGKKPKFVQKGIWSQYLCNDCETYFSKFDTYACDIFSEHANQFFDKRGIKVSYDGQYADHGFGVYRFYGLDAEQLEKFALGVVFRQHLYRKSNKMKGLLSKTQEEIIRAIIRGSGFDGRHFPIQIFATNRNCVAAPPIKKHGDIHFMGAGLLCIVCLTAESIRKADEMVLNPGENIVLYQDASRLGLTKDTAQQIADLPESYRAYINNRIAKKK